MLKLIVSRLVYERETRNGILVGTKTKYIKCYAMLNIYTIFYKVQNANSYLHLFLLFKTEAIYLLIKGAMGSQMLSITCTNSHIVHM